MLHLAIFAGSACQTSRSRLGESSVLESNRLQPPAWMAGPAFKLVTTGSQPVMQCRQKKNQVAAIQLGLKQMAYYGAFTCDRLFHRLMSHCVPSLEMLKTWHTQPPVMKDVYFEKRNALTAASYEISILLEYDFSSEFLRSHDAHQLEACLSGGVNEF